MIYDDNDDDDDDDADGLPLIGAKSIPLLQLIYDNDDGDYDDLL